MRIWFILFCAVAISCSDKQSEKSAQWIASAPAGDSYTQIDRKGTTVIPNGRLITPTGKTDYGSTTSVWFGN